MSTLIPPALLMLLCAATAHGQDTLRFRSEAFGAQREVIVHLPEFHRYAAPEVRMPVIIVLDGQHEWFVDPVLNDVSYLQYTHEVPQAIVVTVPLVDRVAECAPDSVDQPSMPLLALLVQELPPLLAPYHPGDITLLVGHSFSASFALYARLRAPEAFDAVIALSPLHQVARTLPGAVQQLVQDREGRIMVAVGGADPTKDAGHYERLKSAVARALPERAQGRFVFKEYPAAGHTSLPIIAFPELLATYFLPFSTRDTLVPVDEEFRMLAPPPAPEELLAELRHTWTFMGEPLPGELAEFNGILSKLFASGYLEHVAVLAREAARLYPGDHDFLAWQAEALKERDPARARLLLEEALRVLDRNEPDGPDKAELREELEHLLD